MDQFKPSLRFPPTFGNPGLLRGFGRGGSVAIRYDTRVNRCGRCVKRAVTAAAAAAGGGGVEVVRGDGERFPGFGVLAREEVLTVGFGSVAVGGTRSTAWAVCVTLARISRSPRVAVFPALPHRAART